MEKAIREAWLQCSDALMKDASLTSLELGQAAGEIPRATMPHLPVPVPSEQPKHRLCHSVWQGAWAAETCRIRELLGATPYS